VLLANLLVDFVMADASVIDLDTGAVVEKHGRGHPRGSKNNLKDVSMVALSSSASIKRRLGSPLGSKNNAKLSTSLANRSMDANASRHSASPPPPVNVFSFFAIDGAQCREQQRVPLKFTQFMDGRELHQGFLCSSTTIVVH
jgi:hypothetical protein